MKSIFLNGLGQTPSAWNPLLSHWPAREDALCPDLFSLLKDRPATYENLFGALADFLEGVPGPKHLCGLSLGAILALRYAASHPAEVQTLALIAPQYKMPRGLLKLQNAAFHLLPRSFFQRQGVEKSALFSLTRSMMDVNLQGALGKIACPTLILLGIRDRWNRKAAREMAGRIPGAKFQLLENAGHEANLDTPEALSHLLREFQSPPL